MRRGSGIRAPPRPDDRRGQRPPRELRGLALATLGVAIFSFSLPATRLAVADLDPMFVSFGRAAVAAALAAIVLRALRAPRPHGAQWRSLAIVAFGVVVAFPLFTALALRHVDATHGAVVIALLPAWTAVFAVLRAGESPSRGFWLAAGFGLVAVLAFIASRGLGAIELADVELLVATVLCSLAYAEGGALSRTLGGAADDLLGAAARASRSASRSRSPSAPCRRRRHRRLARLRLRLAVLDVPRLLRLVRGPVGAAAWPRPARRSCCRRRSRSRCRRWCSASTSRAAAIVCTVAVLLSIVGTQRARVERRLASAPMRLEPFGTEHLDAAARVHRRSRRPALHPHPRADAARLPGDLAGALRGRPPRRHPRGVRGGLRRRRAARPRASSRPSTAR